MRHLDIDLNTFPFYTREIIDGKVVKNRCGRDFIYYSLVYHRPDHHGQENNAFDLEHNKSFGVSVPAWLAWTQVQFLRVTTYLKKERLILSINGQSIFSFISFVKAILLSRVSLDKALLDIERAIDEGYAAGIDISIGMGGLLDHVMFVYGYDKENLYIFETTRTPINYESISNTYPQVMKLPKTEIKKRWTRFGRVWNIKCVDV